MPSIPFIPYEEFKRIIAAPAEKLDKLQVISDMCRVNTLSAIKKAGSGHIGSSFSSMDIFVYMYFCEMNALETGFDSPDRDVFFSSKGHDAPGQYSVLMAAGVLEPGSIMKLRRLGGLEGHPEISTKGMEANTGSLGMGISKARGMAFAKRLGNHGGSVFVLTGDGELQEGQVWEALQNTSHQGLTNICVIVDANKIQTDKRIKDVIELKNLEAKLTAFGWHVERCDGHSFSELKRTFEGLRNITDRPKVLIADTLKGKGVSFMERFDGIIYRWHSGAPDDESFKDAHMELVSCINNRLAKLNMEPVRVDVPPQDITPLYKVSDEKVVNVYGKALLEIASERKDIVVLDADLSADCGLRPFEEKYPERFIENGIAEQDMVSMAGGLALHGYLPIVHSFSAFLSSRANEQIFINASEGTKIIYVCNYAGMLPAGPGVSHQGVRDISILGGLPNMVALEPCNAVETKLLLAWCVKVAKENCLLRLSIFPSPGPLSLPDNYSLEYGKGTVMSDGRDAVIFAYGPVMLHEALLASRLLSESDISLKVVNMPWLNRVNREWLEEVTGESRFIFVMDNHSASGGLGDAILNTMVLSGGMRDKEFHKFAIEGYPECGTPAEVLRFHKLDGESVADRIRGIIG